jgi:hypothetical protein
MAFLKASGSLEEMAAWIRACSSIASSLSSGAWHPGVAASPRPDPSLHAQLPGEPGEGSSFVLGFPPSLRFALRNALPRFASPSRIRASVSYSIIPQGVSHTFCSYGCLISPALARRKFPLEIPLFSYSEPLRVGQVELE